MNKLLQQLPDKERDSLKKQAMPDWLNPMLATLTHDHFSSPDWIYEHKLDGQRCLVFREEKGCGIWSRNRKSQNGFYPELVDAVAAEKPEFIVDGEIVCYRDGIDSFTALQNRMHVRNPDRALIDKYPAYLHLFDILYLDGYNLTALPLRTRKELLKQTLAFDKPLSYLSHRNEKGEAYLKEACEKGWEGLIAKEADSTYYHSRSTKWLKFKCSRGQEFVIAGFTDPQGERQGFGSLLLGYYDGDELRYAGKVGTGFSHAFLREFGDRLKNRARKTSAFADYDGPGKHVNWVEPRYVGEISFTEWTKSGKLRHPRFLGLRKDKSPKDVVREEPHA